MKTLNMVKTLTFSIAFLFFFVNTLFSQDTGLEIAQKHESFYDGWVNYNYDAKMILLDQRGRSRERRLAGKHLEIINKGDQSLLVFDYPSDVKGLSLLSHTNLGNKEDDLWIFFPASKRQKRISSSNRTGSFAGSEFTYDDLLPRKVENYTFSFIDERNYNEESCSVVKLEPVNDTNSDYSHILIYYNKAKNYRYEKIEYFDRTGTKYKTLTYQKFKLFKEKFWFPQELHMINHKSKKETKMLFENYNFDINLEAYDFEVANLGS